MPSRVVCFTGKAVVVTAIWTIPSHVIMLLLQIYRGHTDLVRCISADPSGQWLVSGSDDLSIRVWEVATGRCMKKISIPEKAKCITWNPNPVVCLVAIVL